MWVGGWVGVGGCCGGLGVGRGWGVVGWGVVGGGGVGEGVVRWGKDVMVGVWRLGGGGRVDSVWGGGERGGGG